MRALVCVYCNHDFSSKTQVMTDVSIAYFSNLRLHQVQHHNIIMFFHIENYLRENMAETASFLTLSLIAASILASSSFAS